MAQGVSVQSITADSKVTMGEGGREAGHVAHAVRKQTVIKNGGASWLPPFHTVQAPSLGDAAAYFLGRSSLLD